MYIHCRCVISILACSELDMSIILCVCLDVTLLPFSYDKYFFIKGTRYRFGCANIPYECSYRRCLEKNLNFFCTTVNAVSSYFFDTTLSSWFFAKGKKAQITSTGPP